MSEANGGAAMARSVRGFEEQLRGEDPGAAPEARVAVRRLRARLALSTPRFDPDWVWLVRRELRWLEQAVGDVADAHALACWVDRQPIDDRDRPARGLLVAELRRERGRAHRRLVALLDSARYERMLRDLERPYLAPEDVARVARREWRSLTAALGSMGESRGLQDLHRLAGRVDRVRHAAELCKAGAKWAVALGEVREALDGVSETTLAQGWLRHAADTPAMHWDLLAGQLLERARGAELIWWDEWTSRLERARAKDLRSWLKRG